MSTEHSSIPAPDSLSLPERPSIDHLKSQAQDLFRSGLAPTLSKSQFHVAKAYGFASWPKLKAHVEGLTRAGKLKAAIDTGDYAQARQLMMDHPELHQCKMGYAGNGPLTWVAECRVPRVAPSADRLAFAQWMIDNGSDVHQGADGPLMRAALDDDRIPMMELLLQNGADVNALWNGNYPIICAPCEALAPLSLAWLLKHGADPERHSQKYGSPLAMVVFTYSRNARKKQACLEVFDRAGYPLPNTPCMALARGRTDLLEHFLRADPNLLARTFSQHEIYPSELGRPADGLTFVPLDGCSLLHMAVEFEDDAVTEWLLAHGADPNARAEIDSDGFGGHTPLYHSVISVGDRSAARASLLLQYGADPNIHTTLRKQLGGEAERESYAMHEYHNVTPIEFARQYQEPAWVNEAAIAAIAKHGGL